MVMMMMVMVVLVMVVSMVEVVVLIEKISFILHFTSPFPSPPIQPKAVTEAAPKEPTAQPQAEEPETQAEPERTVETPPDEEVKRLKHVTYQERSSGRRHTCRQRSKDFLFYV